MRLIDKANINLQLKPINIITHLMYIAIQISNPPYIKLSCSTINTPEITIFIHIGLLITISKQRYKYNLNSNLLPII